MITYQRYKSDQMQELTSEAFSRLIISDDVVNAIKRVRLLRSEGKDKGADLAKRSLPLICFQAKDFMELPAPSDSRDKRRKKGDMGKWRLQAGAILNGLFMLDIDHITSPDLPEGEEGLAQKGLSREKCVEFLHACLLHACPDIAYENWKQALEALGIPLVHVTSSNDGLRFVAMADPAIGNIADNQQALAERLGVKLDETCKDASRGSFCPGFEDIIYINKEKLFNYDNEEYENKYGESYRQTHPRPLPEREGSGQTRGNSSNNQEAQGLSTPLPDREGKGESLPGESPESLLHKTYGGVTYGKIIETWLDETCPEWRETDEKGRSKIAGQRHGLLLRMASDLRYVCDTKKDLLALVQVNPLAQQIIEERGVVEVDNIAADVYRYARNLYTPKRVQAILAHAGVRQSKKSVAKADGEAGFDYEHWWQKLEPLLAESPYLREACQDLPPHHKMAGVLASGAMFGTYLSRCWWQHFDGKPYRLSYLVYIIGGAASGKSRIGDISKLIMAPMLAADKAGRDWERKYDADVRAREMSTKNAREAAPEEQHPVILIVPSTISNNILYERLDNAVDPNVMGPDGEPVHLHLYTYEAELATALRAQGAGAWAAKLDLECKSFQNEDAGVDYKTSKSHNGIHQINWNQVITGTADAMRRKIRKSTVLDGLVTRLCLFRMPDNDYSMIERKTRIINNDRDCMLRAVGLDLDQLSGELPCERLVDYCYEYEAELCKQAEKAADKCLDYFRKRIPIIMIRYALVRAVLRQLKPLLHGEPLQIDDSDLAFARLIGDFCLSMQIWMYGNEVMDALEQEQAAFTPRRTSQVVSDRFEALPTEFTREQVKELMPDMTNQAVSATISRWQEQGAIVKEGKKYRKLTNGIKD